MDGNSIGKLYMETVLRGREFIDVTNILIGDLVFIFGYNAYKSKHDRFLGMGVITFICPEGFVVEVSGCALEVLQDLTIHSKSTGYGSERCEYFDDITTVMLPSEDCYNMLLGNKR